MLPPLDDDAFLKSIDLSKLTSGVHSSEALETAITLELYIKLICVEEIGLLKVLLMKQTKIVHAIMDTFKRSSRAS